MGATERRVQPESQATPLAGDVLGFLQGQIGQGGFGPLTPLQRQAQNSLQNFIASNQPFDLGPLLAQLEQVQGRQVETGAANLREGFGVAGSRFGTPLAAGEAQFRTGAAGDFATTVSQLLQNQFNIGNEQLLQAIGLGGQLSTQNIAPFIQLAGMGILPEQISFEENPFVTGLKALGGAAAGAGSFATGIGLGK